MKEGLWRTSQTSLVNIRVTIVTEVNIRVGIVPDVADYSPSRT